MRAITFDIETQNFFTDVGKNDPTLLDIALLAIHDSETGEFSSYLHDELDSLWPILERADALIGYNSDHFDIPLLNKYYSGDLTQIKSIDLMKEVQNVLGRRLKLDNLAQATLGEAKSAHGALGVQWWREGKIEKVREYCIQDVNVTRKLYDHALAYGILKYKDGNQTREVQLDTSNWEKSDGSALTHTLGF